MELKQVAVWLLLCVIVDYLAYAFLFEVRLKYATSVESFLFLMGPFVPIIVWIDMNFANWCGILK